MALKLYRIRRSDDCDYENYDSAVVVADSEQDAISIHPNGKNKVYLSGVEADDKENDYSSWTTKENVMCELVGTACYTLKAGDVILASFNAG